MQPVTLCARQVTASHSMIRLQVSDDRFDGLTPLELLSLLRCQTRGLTPVHDAYIRVLCIPATVSHVHKHRGRSARPVLHQNGGLLQLPSRGSANFYLSNHSGFHVAHAQTRQTTDPP